ncbi:hypothetical protein BZA70DRAFT_283672 [Myxozyma melibiosi]|uniref:HMG box domain-containing protein n=1 Tax=Myxozyma melibiosi TaxID=54550 RepID=A0ABR1F0T8_9ASCO
MLDLKSRPWLAFQSIVDAVYPEHLEPVSCAHIKKRSVAAILRVDASKILPASGGTSVGYHPLMQKVLTDCRLDIPESADLLAEYEQILHLSRIYRLILLITPDCSLIKQEWIDETLRQHGEKCSKKMADGQKVTARQELHLTRDECQYLLNKLQAADSSNRGYALDVLVSALYSCKVKRPTPNAEERCHQQGYQEIRPQNSFFVFARAFERCVSQGENIRQTSLRMYTKIVWHSVLTEDQRDLFQEIYNEMNKIHSIIHPKYKYVPKFRAPGHHQPPAENGEQSGAVKSSPSVSSQISQAKHAYADANADSRPAKRQCLAMEETTVAAQLVTSMPWGVPDTVAEDYFNGPHHMDCRYAWEESTVAPFYDPTLAFADQSDPCALSQLPQDQSYISFFPPPPAVPYSAVPYNTVQYTAVQYAEAAASIFYTEPIYQTVAAPMPSFQPAVPLPQDSELKDDNNVSLDDSQMVDAPIPLPQDSELKDDDNVGLDDSEMVDAPIQSSLASELLHDKNFNLDDFLNSLGPEHFTPMPARAVMAFLLL